MSTEHRTRLQINVRRGESQPYRNSGYSKASCSCGFRVEGTTAEVTRRIDEHVRQQKGR